MLLKLLVHELDLELQDCNSGELSLSCASESTGKLKKKKFQYSVYILDQLSQNQQLFKVPSKFHCALEW